MREQGFEDFVALWTEQENAEHQAFEAVARKARFHGRLLAYTDIVLVVMVVGISVAGAVLKPSGLMLAISFVMAVSSIALTWKRRKIRQMTRTLDTSSREAFLKTSLQNVSSDLRRLTLSLIVFPLCLPVAILFKVAWRHGGHLAHPAAELAHWATSVRGMITLPIFLFLGAATVRSRLKVKAELRRLKALEAAYRDEAERDSQDSA
ncbi:MAG: hypothetical protein QOE79_2029 [Sphingomonadales bacterium]|jgi:hypothetical protein|nr:hypothetical protein [Sphingomonadales bacterium]MEA3048623.1 hypothetical protein [Sphingomonadales bacterium]